MRRKRGGRGVRTRVRPPAPKQVNADRRRCVERRIPRLCVGTATPLLGGTGLRRHRHHGATNCAQLRQEEIVWMMLCMSVPLEMEPFARQLSRQSQCTSLGERFTFHVTLVGSHGLKAVASNISCLIVQVPLRTAVRRSRLCRSDQPWSL